jgi:hypothetical protein
MLKNSPFYAGFAVDDLERAREFYGQTLGVFDVANVSSDERIASPDTLSLRSANGYAVLIYRKPGHVPAAHTILNFPVDDIEAAVDQLRKAGVEFEQYDQGPLKPMKRASPLRARNRRGSRTRPATSCRSSRSRTSDGRPTQGSE